MAALGRLQWFGRGPVNVGYRQLARVSPADLHIPVLGQSAAGAAPARPRHPDHTAFADLDPELHRLPLGILAEVAGEVKIDFGCATTKQR